jgi:hypothetical protein
MCDLIAIYFSEWFLFEINKAESKLKNQVILLKFAIFVWVFPIFAEISTVESNRPLSRLKLSTNWKQIQIRGFLSVSISLFGFPEFWDSLFCLDISFPQLILIWTFNVHMTHKDIRIKLSFRYFFLALEKL